ncbi:MAG TPA: hypothetical protein VE544_00570 [Nitrososphaeraceae archaeon]|jgi:hypothetical protein|nr:hypothetical protein [Nitrososphaeraceae archaeon]
MELDNEYIEISCLGPPNKKGEGEILTCPYLPVLVHVNALEQTATVELDRDT